MKELIGKLPSLLIKVTLKVSGLGLSGAHYALQESNSCMSCQAHWSTLLVLTEYNFVLILVLPVSYKIILKLECSSRYFFFCKPLNMHCRILNFLHILKYRCNFRVKYFSTG